MTVFVIKCITPLFLLHFFPLKFQENFCYELVSVATVNEYALKGLEKMEEKLPILHQPADKVRPKGMLL